MVKTLNGAPKRIRTANRQNRNLMRYPVAPWVRMGMSCRIAMLFMNYTTQICNSKHNAKYYMHNILVTYEICGDIIII